MNDFKKKLGFKIQYVLLFNLPQVNIQINRIIFLENDTFYFQQFFTPKTHLEIVKNNREKYPIKIIEFNSYDDYINSPKS